MGERRLVVVSNRLPIVLERQKAGKWDIGPGSGGLITALGPVLRNRGGLWIGWLGASSEKLADFSSLDVLLRRGAEESGYALSPVHLSSEEVQNFYFGFSNQILWPLFHDFPTRCNFDPAYWQAYEWVNRKFAQAILDNTTEEDFVWVHDYQLIVAGSELIKMGRKRHTGCFHQPALAVRNSGRPDAVRSRWIPDRARPPQLHWLCSRAHSRSKGSGKGSCLQAGYSRPRGASRKLSHQHRLQRVCRPVGKSRDGRAGQNDTGQPAKPQTHLRSRQTRLH